MITIPYLYPTYSALNSKHFDHDVVKPSPRNPRHLLPRPRPHLPPQLPRPTHPLHPALPQPRPPSKIHLPPQQPPCDPDPLRPRPAHSHPRAPPRAHRLAPPALRIPPPHAQPPHRHRGTHPRRPPPARLRRGQGRGVPRAEEQVCVLVLQRG